VWVAGSEICTVLLLAFWLPIFVTLTV